MAGAFTRSKLCMQFSSARVHFKVGSKCLLHGGCKVYISCIGYKTAVCNGMPTCVLKQQLLAYFAEDE